MSSIDKIGEALRRSLPHLPDEAKGMVKNMLQPATLAIIAGTLIVWAGSHFCGVGEIVDLILLGVGVVFIGFAVFEGVEELFNFATKAIDAKSDDDLEQAGQHFARAVTLLGIATVQALLMKGPVRAVKARTAVNLAENRTYTRVWEMPKTGTVPMGRGLIVSRPAQLRFNASGETWPFGQIRIARNQSISEQRAALYHELVHRFFSPKVGPLRKLRAQLHMTSYARSVFLQYLEEMLAEGFAQLRMHGLMKAFGAYRFPLNGGYSVTISSLVLEGVSIGSIVSGGILFHVCLSSRPVE